MSGFSPGRLRIARERSGLRSKELASRCGVTDQTVSNWEGGKRQPSADDVERVASITGFPSVFFFMSDIDALPDGAVTFRARTRIAARQKRSALAIAAMARELAHWIEERFELPPVTLTEGLPDLVDQPPDLVAALVRTNWLLGDRPISNVIHLLESKGVLVLSLAQDVKEVDAFSFWVGARPVVLLNTRKTAERSRFDAAHELAHLLCHRDRTDKKEEEEANKFAAAFLMPEPDVRAHLPRGIGGLARLITAKRRWGVAFSALACRLHDLGLVTDWQYRMLFLQLSKHGRHREPNAMPNRETSKVMTLVFDALEKQGRRTASVAGDLGWHRVQLDEFIFGLGATLLPVDGGRRVKREGTATADHLQLVNRRTSR